MLDDHDDGDDYDDYDDGNDEYYINVVNVKKYVVCYVRENALQQIRVFPIDSKGNPVSDPFTISLPSIVRFLINNI